MQKLDGRVTYLSGETIYFMSAFLVPVYTALTGAGELYSPCQESRLRP